MGSPKQLQCYQFFMKVYTVPCYDRGHVNDMFVLQSSTDSMQVLQGSSSEMFPTSSDGTYDVSNIKLEEEIDIKEEDEVNVKEEEIDIKDEEGIYSEEEEEDRHTKEYKDVEVKEEVRCEDAV